VDDNGFQNPNHLQRNRGVKLLKVSGTVNGVEENKGKGVYEG